MVTAALVSDTGSSAADHITNNAALTGTAEAGRTVTISNGGNVLGSVLAGAGGVWNFNPVLADGSYGLTASETDLANNTGSTTLAVTLDTAAPVVTAALVSDTGSSATDHITNNAALTGTAEANSTVTIRNGAAVLGTTTAGAGGVWNFNPALADGSYGLTASETDLANNTGSTTLAFTLDTAAPVVTAALVSDTGSSATDHITNNAALTGTAEANSTVTIRNGATVLGTTTAGAGGVWNFNPTLADGSYGLTASETDLANNTGSTTLAFTLDTAAPIAPNIAQVVAAAISGSAEANSTLSLFDGGTQIGATSTSGTGAWSISVTLTAGNHTLAASAKDLSNNVSAPSEVVTAVVGTAGDDVLSDVPGTVILLGGTGNDTYAVNNSLDVVTESAGEGAADTVVASVNYSLTAGSEVEVLKASGSTGLTLTGNEVANTITGGAGNDTLSGGGGDDTFVATIGDGNDNYNGGAGVDTYDLSATAADATVNLAQGKASSLDIGTDTLTLNTIENLTGGSGNDLLVGDTRSNVLIGGTGNDTLNGGAGADIMIGGAGNDTYLVDNAADVVNELALEGTDTVFASVNYALTAGQAIEFLRANAGATGLSLTGNDIAGTIVGGAGADTLAGGLGNDSLQGGGGNDTLSGGGGNDTLDGGAGADSMAGGAGNDTYLVDNVADIVTEAPGEGTDQVLAAVSYTLLAGVEVETLKASTTTGVTLTGNASSHNLIGNVGNDTLIGGTGNDTLNGGAGADTMLGGAGNDTYLVDNAADVVNELAGLEGTDLVFASVNYALTAGQAIEFLRANAGATGLSLTGNDIAGTIVGGAGADTLAGGLGNELAPGRRRQRPASGGGGNDTLDGGAGADTMTGGAGNGYYLVDNVADIVTEAPGDWVPGKMSSPPST